MAPKSMVGAIHALVSMVCRGCEPLN
ncbi:protein of unknown function (plasmid) [Cupriavidus taiwanensis]|uniref:Uncharacterized protein n=1 Tax=Cupriavidus taiwanensis TaxID=164546 RepID=A0A375IT20_9BURK|nr:protein of unknown function [Cupriavidus taiwanensis]